MPDLKLFFSDALQNKFLWETETHEVWESRERLKPDEKNQTADYNHSTTW